MMEKGKRLYSANLAEEYPGIGKIKENVRIESDALLQKDYGKEFNCTITCMASMFGEQYYSIIENIAKQHGYNGKKHGTNPFYIKAIMREVMQEIGVNGKSKVIFIKDIGYRFETLKMLIKKKMPFILNLRNDGRNYYKDHSVLVVGYMVYESGNRFIVTYDNWHKSTSYIDFDKLSIISSLNWYEPFTN